MANSDRSFECVKPLRIARHKLAQLTDPASPGHFEARVSDSTRHLADGDAASKALMG